MYRSDNNILGHMKLEDRKKIRASVVKGILATDMAGEYAHCFGSPISIAYAWMFIKLPAHFGLTNTLQNVTNKLTRESPDDRQLVINAIVHASDLSNPALPQAISMKWADLVAMEFNEQVPSIFSSAL